MDLTVGKKKYRLLFGPSFYLLWGNVFQFICPLSTILNSFAMIERRQKNRETNKIKTGDIKHVAQEVVLPPQPKCRQLLFLPNQQTQTDQNTQMTDQIRTFTTLVATMCTIAAIALGLNLIPATTTS